MPDTEGVLFFRIRMGRILKDKKRMLDVIT